MGKQRDWMREALQNKIRLINIRKILAKEQKKIKTQKLKDEEKGQKLKWCI